MQHPRHLTVEHTARPDWAAADAPVPLAVRGFSVAYGDALVVEDMDATFPAGTMTAIVGPNGAGKSSLIKAALGILPVVAGEARFFGAALPAVRDRVAYVPQRAGVDWDFPARVIDVVEMGLYRQLGLFGRLQRRHRARAMECLARVGLSDFARRQIGALSGGQQQRVFLARALAQEAGLILLDEPFAGVDAATERALVSVLQGLRDDGCAVVAVHHDLATVPVYFDRVLLMNRVRIAEGPTASTFTEAALAATYGLHRPRGDA
jgi:manganese/zinc/iron transport system ATP- binding protein